jgi:hypothetical protein
MTAMVATVAAIVATKIVRRYFKFFPLTTDLAQRERVPVMLREVPDELKNPLLLPGELVVGVQIRPVGWFHPVIGFSLASWTAPGAYYLSDTLISNFRSDSRTSKFVQ